MHASDINEDIQLIKEIENEFLDPMIRGTILGAFRETFESKIEETLNDHDVRICVVHFFKFRNESCCNSRVCPGRCYADALG